MVDEEILSVYVAIYIYIYIYIYVKEMFSNPYRFFLIFFEKVDILNVKLFNPLHVTSFPMGVRLALLSKQLAVGACT